ncbi:uncharacterized protein PAN0_022c6084 [Moesziomyces antarcticus]|uniref:Uncharacterized protein n=1 Tax=Pseudozyma antarctica TaxID=84753 RepID=A0A081CMF8_PSEA2|nr:uncharacterized protein PAN0_022c6084 [Moesziomyces antarcticus]GAK67854.1 hypothetical protein PAN0_022c6084 [Moesziomyces antarcticus]
MPRTTELDLDTAEAQALLTRSRRCELIRRINRALSHGRASVTAHRRRALASPRAKASVGFNPPRSQAWQILRTCVAGPEQSAAKYEGCLRCSLSSPVLGLYTDILPPSITSGYRYESNEIIAIDAIRPISPSPSRAPNPGVFDDSPPLLPLSPSGPTCAIHAFASWPIRGGLSAPPSLASRVAALDRSSVQILPSLRHVGSSAGYPMNASH